MTDRSQTALPLIYAAAILTIVLWGGTPAATRIAADAVDPATVGLLRTVLAAPALLLIVAVMRLARPTDAGGWLLLILSGLCGFALFPILFSLGIARTSTGHAALIIASAPIATGLIGFIWQKAWPRPLWWGGASVAMTGEAMLIWERGLFGTGAAEATVEGDLLVALGTAFVALGYVAGGRLSARIGAWPTTCWGVGLTGIPLAAWTMWRWGETDWSNVGVDGWLALAYLAIPSTIIGYAAWYWAIEKGGVARIAPIQFGQPVVSLVIAVILFMEPVTPATWAATAAILSGVWLARRA